MDGILQSRDVSNGEEIVPITHLGCCTSGITKTKETMSEEDCMNKGNILGLDLIKIGSSWTEGECP